MGKREIWSLLIAILCILLQLVFNDLPSSLGDLVKLRELNLTNNSIRNLPYEIGKLFRLQSLGKREIYSGPSLKPDRFRRVNGKSIAGGDSLDLHGIQWSSEIIDVFSG